MVGTSGDRISFEAPPVFPEPPTLAVSFLYLALIAGLAPGQDGPSTDSKITVTPEKTQKITDLASRYRFSEKYTTDDERTVAGLVGPYRVAIVEVVKDSFDSPQGAPKRTESSRQAIFTSARRN